MKIIHRLTVGDEPERREALSSLGVKFGTPDSPLVSFLWFDLDESDPAWREVRALMAKWKTKDGGDPNVLGIAHTEFTKSELDDAPFLQMLAWLHGYPQPEGDFGYREATYDSKDYCSACGIGAKQVAPFRMKGEPKWGKRNILQLNWVFDEFFVQPTVWEEVFQPLGVGRLAVLDHRTGKELQTVVQLEIKTVAKSALLLGDEHPTETCSTCRRKKYHPISRGYFPPFANDPAIQIGRTQESFGSGAEAWNATIISQAVRKALMTNKVVGPAFYPLQK